MPATTTSVDSSTSAQLLIAADTTRISLTIQNDDENELFLGYTSGVTTTLYAFRRAYGTGYTFTPPESYQAFYGVWDADGGGGANITAIADAPLPAESGFITTYAQLKTLVAAWLKPNTVLTAADSAAMANYIALAESHFNLNLRHARMRATAAISFVDGVANVPANLLEVEYIGMTQDPFTELFPANVDPLAVSAGYNPGGTPRHYEWIGGEFMADTPATFTASIRYRRTIPALSASAPSNWLLAQFPGLYLYRSVLEGDTRYMDTEQLQIVNARYEQEMKAFDNVVRLQHYGRIQISASSRGVA